MSRFVCRPFFVTVQILRGDCWIVRGAGEKAVAKKELGDNVDQHGSKDHEVIEVTTICLERVLFFYLEKET